MNIQKSGLLISEHCSHLGVNTRFLTSSGDIRTVRIQNFVLVETEQVFGQTT